MNERQILEAKRRMRKLLNLGECIDKQTGEIDHMNLAELTADELDLYYENYNIPPEMVELATHIIEEFKVVT